MTTKYAESEVSMPENHFFILTSLKYNHTIAVTLYSINNFINLSLTFHYKKSPAYARLLYCGVLNYQLLTNFFFYLRFDGNATIRC